MNFIEAVQKEYPGKQTFTRPELTIVAEKYSLRKQFTEFMTTDSNKIKRGLYKIDPNFVQEIAESSAVVELKKPKPVIKKTLILEQKMDHINDIDLIPDRDSEFVPFGDFSLLKKIISSKTFFPVYISGESGNGKTKMVYEACAQSKTQLIRANITESTDEDDLLGGYRLVNGETVWQDGPVVEAMKRGAVLLLDEINLASPKIMCLQPILEGNPIYIKKTNTIVHPVHGFNIIATANTKGKSSDDGRYIGSNTLNEALLDRFAINIEHEYPAKDVEIAILSNILETFESKTKENVDFVNILVEWAKTIRDTFEAGGVDEIITTRRLIHILRFYLIAGGNRMRSIRYCTSRFDTDTKKSFYSLYQKMDASVNIDPENFKTAQTTAEDPENILF
jgi:AAA domain (dynein-related subfamily)